MRRPGQFGSWPLQIHSVNDRPKNHRLYPPGDAGFYQSGSPHSCPSQPSRCPVSSLPPMPMALARSPGADQHDDADAARSSCRPDSQGEPRRRAATWQTVPGSSTGTLRHGMVGLDRSCPTHIRTTHALHVLKVRRGAAGRRHSFMARIWREARHTDRRTVYPRGRPSGRAPSATASGSVMVKTAPSASLCASMVPPIPLMRA